MLQSQYFSYLKKILIKIIMKIFVRAVFLLPIWYLGNQNQDLTLGLEYDPKAIGEVSKTHFAQGPSCIQQRL